MKSYTNHVKALVNSSVYNRGLKLYLDGGVVGTTKSILPNWSLFTMLGNYENEYLVRMPLAHLLVSPAKFESEGGDILYQMATCECEYFMTTGICKHVVAVCALLDAQLGFDSSPKHISSSQDESVMEHIFEAEKVRNHRLWLDLLNQYTYKDIHHFYELDKMAKEVGDNPEFHKEFLTQVAQIAEQIIGDYKKEKKIVQVILETILVGKKTWWDFWVPFVSRMDEDVKPKLFIGFWKIHLVGADREFKDELLHFIKDLPTDQKTTILNNIQKEFRGADGAIWVDYALEIGLVEWLEDHIRELDPMRIIELCLLQPEKREDYEHEIARHVKTWADFLKAGEYRQIHEVFETWRQKLGTSTVYDETVLYLKQTHPKKKTLWRGL